MSGQDQDPAQVPHSRQQRNTLFRRFGIRGGRAGVCSFTAAIGRSSSNPPHSERIPNLPRPARPTTSEPAYPSDSLQRDSSGDNPRDTGATFGSIMESIEAGGGITDIGVVDQRAREVGEIHEGNHDAAAERIPTPQDVSAAAADAAAARERRAAERLEERRAAERERLRNLREDARTIIAAADLERELREEEGRLEFERR